ncbi:MAG: DUF1772 domain-containing protein [Ferruginibacter sp.]
MKRIILFATIIIGSGVLVTNIYTSVVDNTSWGSDIPNSVATARNYYQKVNPGNFFRIFSPLLQFISLLAFILYWKTARPVRWLLAAAFLFFILGEMMTFNYFYPKNEILFATAKLNDVELLTKTWQEWRDMNWVRTAVVFAGVVCSCISLHKVYTISK